MRITSYFLYVSLYEVIFTCIYANYACDIFQIQSKLLPNGTEYNDACQSKTGYNIFLLDKYPSEEQVQTLSHTRECTDVLNQINSRANQLIQCDVNVNGTNVSYGWLISTWLMGKTGNPLNETESMSDDNGSYDVEPSSLTNSTSESDSTSKDEDVGKQEVPKKKEVKPAHASASTESKGTSVCFSFMIGSISALVVFIATA
uniref:Elicitinlike protein putative n=1 Tax=Albugo laibachii Nc14 TaxID=890382 RepID=F0W8F8_9STRA|nr:elicitinlike protein putative [Albugo laibachii Nc14]|eukprot:CCA17413.1 elicitinlike protein putative [Albugo laibachii Nc14]